MRICVFCGSSPGRLPEYRVAAELLAKVLVRRNIGLVYGGGNTGLMGVIANAVLQAGGEVVGIMPRSMVEREKAHAGLTELRVVASMHERKAAMYELADGFIALPGGFGTFEEFCEVLTWTQLGLQRKPCGVLNVAGFYDGLLAFFDHARDEAFVKPAHRTMIVSSDVCEELLDRMLSTELPSVQKWITPSET